MEYVKQSLKKHCDALGIPLEVITVDRDDTGWRIGQKVFQRPESAALELFRQDGWEGTDIEGGPITMAIKCAGFGWLAEHNLFQTRLDAIRDAPISAIVRHPDKLDSFFEEVETCSLEIYREHFSEIYSDPIVRSFYPNLNIDFMAKFFTALGPKLGQIARIFTQNPGEYRLGWPDLCLVKDGTTQFVEIKTTDNIHRSQYVTISSIIIPIGLTAKVLKLSPSLNDRLLQ